MSNLPNIAPYGDVRPRISGQAYVDPRAYIVGDVEIEAGAGIWPGAVLRSDDAFTLIQERAMVLENCVLEAPTGAPIIIKRDAIVSHGAIVHGADIGERAIVGIGAIVLDRSRIGSDCIIGAGAVVPPGTDIPQGKLVLGVPAKVIREVTAEERDGVLRELESLVRKATLYKAYHDRSMEMGLGS